MLAAVLVALLLRCWQPGLVHFGIDESIASAVATQIGFLQRFPLVGIQTSFGFHNPPTYLYLLAPLFRLSPDPRIAALLPMVAGALAVVFCWLAARLLAGDRAGLYAAWIIAVCPNAVEHSRRLWGHDLIVPFAAFSLMATLLAMRESRARWLALSFIAAVMAQSLHLSGILCWIPGLLALLSLPARARWKTLLAALLAILLVYTPWLINEVREGWPGMRAISGHLLGGAAGRELELPVGALPGWVLSLADFWSNDLLGSRRPWSLSPIATAASLVVTILAVFYLGLAIGHAFLKLLHAEDRVTSLPLISLLATMLAAPLVFGVIFKASVPPYILPALPAIIIGAAWALASLHRSIGLALMVTYCFASVFLVYTVRGEIGRGAGTSIPLAEKMEVVLTIQDLAADRPFRLYQDGRSTEAGIDVAWVYLFHWADMSAQHRRHTPQAVFVVHDPFTRVRPEILLTLRQYPVVELDRLRLYELPISEHALWQRVLSTYPAPRNSP